MSNYFNFMANSQRIAHFIPTEPDFEFYAIYKNT